MLMHARGTAAPRFVARSSMPLSRCARPRSGGGGRCGAALLTHCAVFPPLWQTAEEDDNARSKERKAMMADLSAHAVRRHEAAARPASVRMAATPRGAWRLGMVPGARPRAGGRRR